MNKRMLAALVAAAGLLAACSKSPSASKGESAPSFDSLLRRGRVVAASSGETALAVKAVDGLPIVSMVEDPASGQTSVVRFDTARDTMEEADFAHSVAGAAPVALVTSASHMPRAAALLRKTGLVVVPCPTDFKARANREFRWTDWMFDAGALDNSTTAAYERLGGAWAWLRGKI